MIRFNVSIAEVTYENDIFIVYFNQHTDIDGTDLIQMFEKMEEVSGHKPYMTLYYAIDLEVGHITKTAFKENQSRKVAVNRIAESFATNVLAIRLLINFYHKVFPPKFPSKAFKTPEEAQAWLNSLKVKK